MSNKGSHAIPGIFKHFSSFFSPRPSFIWFIHAASHENHVNWSLKKTFVLHDLFSRTILAFTTMERQSLSFEFLPSRKSNINISNHRINMILLILQVATIETRNRQKAIAFCIILAAKGIPPGHGLGRRSFLRHWHAHVIRTHLLVDSLNPQPVMRQSAAAQRPCRSIISTRSAPAREERVSLGPQCN